MNIKLSETALFLVFCFSLTFMAGFQYGKSSTENSRKSANSNISCNSNLCIASMLKKEVSI